MTYTVHHRVPCKYLKFEPRSPPVIVDSRPLGYNVSLSLIQHPRGRLVYIDSTVSSSWHHVTSFWYYRYHNITVATFYPSVVCGIWYLAHGDWPAKKNLTHTSSKHHNSRTKTLRALDSELDHDAPSRPIAPLSEQSLELVVTCESSCLMLATHSRDLLP